jgi:hypothetical protein
VFCLDDVLYGLGAVVPAPSSFPLATQDVDGAPRLVSAATRGQTLTPCCSRASTGHSPLPVQPVFHLGRRRRCGRRAALLRVARAVAAGAYRRLQPQALTLCVSAALLALRAGWHASEHSAATSTPLPLSVTFASWAGGDALWFTMLYLWPSARLDCRCRARPRTYRSLRFIQHHTARWRTNISVSWWKDGTTARRTCGSDALSAFISLA